MIIEDIKKNAVIVDGIGSVFRVLYHEDSLVWVENTKTKQRCKVDAEWITDFCDLEADAGYTERPPISPERKKAQMDMITGRDKPARRSAFKIPAVPQ